MIFLVYVFPEDSGPFPSGGFSLKTVVHFLVVVQVINRKVVKEKFLK